MSAEELRKAHKLLKRMGVKFLDKDDNDDDGDENRKEKKDKSRRKLNYDDAEYDSELDDSDSDAPIMGQNKKKKKKNKRKKKKKKKKKSEGNGKREIDDDTTSDDENEDDDDDDDETETDNDDDENENENENENDNENENKSGSDDEDDDDDDGGSQIKSFALLKKKRNQLATLEMLNDFTVGISECAEIMAILLSSKTQSDVLECIEFFKVACTFKISTERIGFQKMLPLVWNKDNQAIINAVLKAYYFKYIHIGSDKIHENETAEEELNRNLRETLKVASNLVKLTYGATLADITCIEELIRLLVTDKSDPKMKNVTIKTSVFDALFSIFGMCYVFCILL